jgi:hypothetical protein
VAAAYRDLRARGTVVSAERRGVRVAARSPLTARAAPGGSAPAATPASTDAAMAFADAPAIWYCADTVIASVL